MDYLAQEQQEIMRTLSDLQASRIDTLDDIEINELFASLLDEAIFDHSDWTLEFTDLHAIKYFDTESFERHLNYKYLIHDNADEYEGD